MSWTPIKAVYVSAAATIPAEVSALNVRIREIYFNAASVANGEVVITHVSASGDQVVKFGFTSTMLGGSLNIPEAGLRCPAGFYVTQPADCRLTIFYD